MGRHSSDEHAGAVFVEVSEAVRDSLAQLTPSDHLVRLLTTLDADDLAFVSDAVPPDLLARASAALEGVERSVFEDSIQYKDQTFEGAFMTREWVAVPDSSTVESTIAELRRLGALPPQTDRLFVVDARHVLVGTVPLEAILVQPPETPISGLVIDTPAFGAFDEAADAVTAFERYDLVSAPVVDGRGKLIGRLTVDAAMDVMRAQATLQALRTAGLREDEDLFAPPLVSARNRWPWLGVNLVTAFIVSRVIGQFEGTIAQMASHRRPHADRGEHRRQHRQPDDGDRDSGAGGRSGPTRGRREAVSQRAHRQPVERGAVGRTGRAVRVRVLRQRRPRRRDEHGRGAESHRRGAGGCGDSVAAPRDRSRPGPGRERTADVRHRFHGLLSLPRPRQCVADLRAHRHENFTAGC